MSFSEQLNMVLALSEIIELSEQQKMVFEKIPFTAKVNMSLEKAFVIRGIEKLIVYETVISSLYEEKAEIYNTVSRNKYIDYVSSLLFKWKLEEFVVTEQQINEIYQHFIGIEKIEYLIIKGVFGIRLLDNSKKLDFGPFEIYHLDTYRVEITKLTKLNQELLWIGWQHEYLTTIKIEARDADKAKEIAYSKFYQLELFISYSIGQYKEEFTIKIVSQITNQYDNCLILSKESIVTPLSRIIIDFIPLDDPYFLDPSIGNDKLWKLLEIVPANKMRKRIISAIEWIGKANSEANIKNRFLFYLISLESIFTFQEKTLISPSVVNNLSEGVAFILGRNKEERLEIEKIIKNLYEIRSALSHGYEKDISTDELELASIYSRNIIRALLVEEQLYSIDSPEKLNKYFKELKYS